MSWGYGYSPVMKDKCYAQLVVAWGPLIQLYVLNDLLDDSSQKFIDDGYFVLMPGAEKEMPGRNQSANLEENRRSSIIKQINPYEQVVRWEAMRSSFSNKNNPNRSPFEMKNLFIERIWHLSDSVILVMTCELEFRLFYT